jgi:hypothetical protein
VKGYQRKKTAITASFCDEAGDVIFCQNALLTPDKKANLQKPDIEKNISFENGTATLTLRSNVYARYVRVEVEGLNEPLSDNYFDLEAGREYSVHFPVPSNMDESAFDRRVTVKTLADVSVRGTAIGDSFRRFLFRLKPYNLLTWLLYKFV